MYAYVCNILTMMTTFFVTTNGYEIMLVWRLFTLISDIIEKKIGVLDVQCVSTHVMCGSWSVPVFCRIHVHLRVRIVSNLLVQ